MSKPRRVNGVNPATGKRAVGVAPSEVVKNKNVEVKFADGTRVPANKVEKLKIFPREKK
jgi:hypothetical protein